MIISISSSSMSEWSLWCVQIHRDRASDESQVLVHNEKHVQDDCCRLGRFLASLLANSTHYGIVYHSFAYLLLPESQPGVNSIRLQDLSNSDFSRLFVGFPFSSFYHPSSKGGIVFGSFCVFCLSVCLHICQHDNSWTVRDIITKFSYGRKGGQVRKWL